MEDEIFERDEFAGEPKGGAGVVEMRALAETLAQRASGEAFIEPGEGVFGLRDGAKQGWIEARGEAFRDGGGGAGRGLINLKIGGVSH